MNHKKKKSKILLTVLALMVLLGGMFHKNAVMTVQAETGSSFSIEAELLRSDSETYDVRLTVENKGSDWEGIVRLLVDENYQVPSAFDTVLSLPQGSKKQFVVRVPVNSVRSTNGTITASFLTGNKVVAEKRFDRLLTGQITALSMGILSDAYPELTYLDMGGRELYFHYDYYPIKLVELEQGSLEDELDTLEFLVIDQYSTGILTAEEMKAIELWNYNGGILIIGTGSYAEDTLSGFDGGYLEISYAEIHAPGEEYAINYPGYGYTDLDMSQLTMAELQETSAGYSYSKLYEDSFFRGLFGSIGNGSVCVLPYSFTELGQMDESFWRSVDPEDFVQGLMDNASSNAGSRYSTSSYYYDDYSYSIKNLLGVMGYSNNVLNFGLLKVIVILYVIFVGPVLYLVLRLLKRRELYWIAVPVSALFGIVLIFFAGRGFEVVGTRVYSVTMMNPSDDIKSTSYLYCYDASRREWNLKLAEGCEYVGPYNDSYYYYSILGGDTSYHYRIKKEGDVLSLGVNPDSNFEDSYFYLSSTGNGSGVEGSLLMQNMSAGINGLSGTIVNDTNKDMPYFAVIVDDSLSVYKGLPAGANCRLQDAELLYTTSNYYYSWYIYDFLQDYYSDGKYREISALAALGVGVYDIYSHQHDVGFAVIGVVENWDKTVDDDCSEISYGCLYSVQ